MKPLASSDGGKTLAPSETRLTDIAIWDFAVAFYQQPSVEADCLAAQDTHNLDVTVLIFALYRASRHEGFDTGIASDLARTLSARLIEPLRAARLALKSMPQLVDQLACANLRVRVKEAELEAERLTLGALAELPVKGEVTSYEAALLAIASASQVAPSLAVTALLKRLALAAQNM